MTETTKKEKIFTTLLIFLTSFFVSIFLIDLETIRFELYRFGYINIIKYFLTNFSNSVFFPLSIPFLMLKNIDSYSGTQYIITTVILTIIIPLILYIIYLLIKKSSFQGKKGKLFNYVILFVCFNMWFLIALIALNMGRI